MIDHPKLRQESIDRCKKLINELDLDSGGKIVMGFLENPEELDALLKVILAFAMFTKFANRMQEFKILTEAATVLSIEKSLFNQFEEEMKNTSPRN